MAYSPYCWVNGVFWLSLSGCLAAAAPVNRLELHGLGQASHPLWALQYLLCVCVGVCVCALIIIVITTILTIIIIIIIIIRRRRIIRRRIRIKINKIIIILLSTCCVCFAAADCFHRGWHHAPPQEHPRRVQAA